ncbi:hypothetical protein BJX70DRAFT_367482 [Aspergillus crustosus]
MSWSIDTAIAGVTLLFTAIPALLAIWTCIANTYRRTAPQGKSSPEASVDQEVVLELGLHTDTRKAQDSKPILTRRTQSV